MRIFLDANIIMEYLAHRSQYDDVESIFQAAEQKLVEACVSTMSVDSVTYLLGVHLKAKGVHEPQKRYTIMEMLNSILGYLWVVDISQSSLTTALNDETFKDIEDSYQYHCAIENGCQCLVTINVKDFPKASAKNADQTDIEVLSPHSFVKAYME